MRTTTGIQVQQLEGRRLLSGTMKPPTREELSDPNYGIEHDTTVIVSDEFVSIVGDVTRKGNFKLPAVGADGSVDIVGSGDADNITVTHSVGTEEAEASEGEVDFLSYIDADGNRKTMSSTLNPDTFEKNAIGTNLEALARAKADVAKDIADGVGGQWLETDKNRVKMHETIDAQNKYILQKLKTAEFVHYQLEGVYDLYVEVAPNMPASAKITVDAGGGDDKVSIASNVPMRTNLNGGSGADTLTSGKRATYMVGGSGNDRLISRSLKGGTLDGGKGKDRYYNHSSANGTAGEIRVLARNDGDRVIVPTGASVPVTQSGLFGNAAIGRNAYFLMDSSGGQVDLLA